jgi:hypothetical protein
MNSQTVLRKKWQYMHRTIGVENRLSEIIEQAKREGIEPYQFCVIRRGDVNSVCESPHVMLSLQWFGPDEPTIGRRLHYKQISDPLLEKISSAICQARSEGIEPFELKILGIGTRIAGLSFDSAMVVLDWFSPCDGPVYPDGQVCEHCQNLASVRTV